MPIRHPHACLLAVTAVALLETLSRPAAAYSLLDPTPTSQMREFTPDRPSKTGSPFTLDAGHFELEMDAANYGQAETADAVNKVSTRTWTVAPTTLRVGVSDNFEVQLAFTPVILQQTSDANKTAKSNISGTGDLVVRGKVNVVGNDGGAVALSLSPFIKMPTASRDFGNGKVEGGLAGPLAVTLGNGLALGLQTEGDLNADDAGPGHHIDLTNSFVLTKQMSSRLSIYGEFYTVRDTAKAAWSNTADFGATYLLTPNVQLDAGINIGLTKAADNFVAFTGVAIRW